MRALLVLILVTTGAVAEPGTDAIRADAVKSLTESAERIEALRAAMTEQQDSIERAREKLSLQQDDMERGAARARLEELRREQNRKSKRR